MKLLLCSLPLYPDDLCSGCLISSTVSENLRWGMEHVKQWVICYVGISKVHNNRSLTAALMSLGEAPWVLSTQVTPFSCSLPGQGIVSLECCDLGRNESIFILGGQPTLSSSLHLLLMIGTWYLGHHSRKSLFYPPPHPPTEKKCE